MKLIFADTFYWIALINQKDDCHERVILFSSTLDQVEIVTTDEVLTELLNSLSTYGQGMRKLTLLFVQDIFNNPHIRVIPQAHDSFQQGLALYEHRLDKGYNLTGCISMQVMKQLKITEVLTHDKHFKQEGFVVLFQD